MIYRMILPFSKGVKSLNKFFYKGEFYIYFDDSSYIRDIDVKFTQVDFDTCSTYSKFRNKKNPWVFKNELIEKWNLKHLKRCPNNGLRPKKNCDHIPKCPDNNIVKLDYLQLENISHKFNTWRDKKGNKLTIKNLDTVISGSNPSGEVKRPENSTFKIDKGDYHNFATFIKKLWNRNEKLSRQAKWLSQEISFNDHLKLFPWFKPFYKAIQYSMNEEEKQIFNARTKETESLAEHIKFTQKVNRIITQKRLEFRNEMNSLIKLISGYEWYIAKKQKEYRNFERAHIKPVSHVRRELLSNWHKYLNTNLENLNLLDSINDSDNGIWLSPDHHVSFDNGEAYISKTWHYILDDEEIFEIPEKYWNDKRQKYIQYHHNNVYKKGI